MKYDYDLICIGLGPAGMAVSIMASEMGLNVCAVEKHKIGGECMNCGCIPSKALLKMAEARHMPNRFHLYQLEKSSPPAVLEPFKKIAADLDFINKKKTLKMFDKVELMLEQGPASFVDPNTVKVGEKIITARRVFIATGTKPMILPIPGIDDVDVETNETIFRLEEVPESLTVLGGGAIACEMAQAFCRMGSRVMILQRSAHLLSKGDPGAASILEKSFKDEGIKVITGDTPARLEQRDGRVTVTTAGGLKLESEKILAGWGRVMNLDELELQKAGIEYNDKGIRVDAYLRTTRKNIFAVGDCNGYHLFSHAAMHQGMIALMNSMLPVFMKRDFRKYAVPSTIFTTPQISQVGMNEKELKEKGVKYETHTVKYEDYGAAIAEELKDGFVKVCCSSAGRIYGVVIVGDGSGEMINEWALAVQNKLRMHEIMFLQHSFPTMGFLSKRVAETWMMQRMKSAVLKKLCGFFYRL